MFKTTCLLKLGTVTLHLYQIIAGFHELQRRGLIDLKVEKLKSDSPEKPPLNMMEAVLNNEIRILYDVNDGYDNLLSNNENYVDFMDHLLKDYDICFKRSFSAKYNTKLKYGYKIYPLGLNYMVTVKENIAHFPMPCDPFQEKMKKIIRMLPISEHYNGNYTIDTFEGTPKKDTDPKILFMARMWEVSNVVPADKKSKERTYINHFRAQCIRLCQKELGARFIGGVSPSAFAQEHYDDIVIQDKQITKRSNYLKLVKDASICIATMGLHESIGWKFAEYVAASKAIVTEELNYEVPGSFSEGQNYLTFRTPIECVEQIYKLLDSDELRIQMQMNNHQYYRDHVRPDQLVLTSILTTQQIPAVPLVKGV